ncbi:MAG: helix-turn-helix domain-containing protein [Alphaproteobacteria bacterium]|nr:helix-turn-helix domain-containing protein [Alphaproteobacteria bacterium]
METPKDRLLLNAPQVAALLNISRALAYRWMQDGTLPVLRAPSGRVVRVPRAALEQWIEENTREAQAGGCHE